MKIKVCHFSSVHAATDGRFFEKECRALAQAGYEVYIVAPNTNLQKDCLAQRALKTIFSPEIIASRLIDVYDKIGVIQSKMVKNKNSTKNG